ENKSLYKQRSKVEHAFAKLKHNYKLDRFRDHGINMNSIVLATYQMAINAHVLHGMGLGEQLKKLIDKGNPSVKFTKCIIIVKKSNLELSRLTFLVI
ncbi:MAG: transposase, partial [Erysipelotrichaceae bacterium]